MRNKDAIVWFLGWPLVSALCDVMWYITHGSAYKYSFDGALFEFIFYIFIGMCLWNKKGN